MSRKPITYGLSFLSIMATAVVVFAQAAATPPSPPAKDREPHAKSRPQETTPRVKEPNTDALGNKALPPSPDNPVLDPDDLNSDPVEETKPSEIRSTVSTPATVRPVRDPLKVDALLATYIAIGNQKEVVLGTIGIERAQLPAVKDFATMIERDHQAFLDRLQIFAPDATKPGYLNIVAPPTRSGDIASRGAPPAHVLPSNSIDDTVSKPKPNDADPEEAAALELPVRPVPTRGSVGPTMQLMQAEREVAGQFLIGSKEMLQMKRGLDFDKCFISEQIVMHLAMKSKLTVYQRHVSPELSAVLAEGEQMVDEHLTKAMQLMKTLEMGTTPAAKVAPKSAERTIKAQAKE